MKQLRPIRQNIHLKEMKMNNNKKIVNNILIRAYAM